MARLNKRAPARPASKTHEGGVAARIPNKIAGMTFDAVGKAVPVTIDRPLEQLRRSVLACLLWEDTFYEDGQSVADRIWAAADQVSLVDLGSLALEARTTYNLRSVPMLLVAKLVERAHTESKTGVAGLLPLPPKYVQSVVEQTVQRADELAEVLAVYWRNGKRPLSKQLQKGLAKAFTKFDAYQLAKYDRANAIRLRDVLFLTHPKARDEAQQALWDQLAKGEIPTPDTWETELSAGKDKKATFERLLNEGRLGYMALLRNLRNMANAGVDPMLVTQALLARKGAHRVLPFRYVAAARAVPQFELTLDQALVASIADLPALPGRTVVLVDVSGSMDAPLARRSRKTGAVENSDLNRIDAAATLASVIPMGTQQNPSGSLRVFTFSDRLVEVAPRRGMAGVDAIRQSQPRSGTYLKAATTGLASGNVVEVTRQRAGYQSLLDRSSVRVMTPVEYDRLIVITDEQSQDGGPVLREGAKGYLINVAPYEHGVAYKKPWVHLTGFSENVIRFIAEFERAESAGEVAR